MGRRIQTSSIWPALIVLSGTSVLVGCDDDPSLQAQRPGISVGRSTVDFGDVQVGTAATQEVVIENTGLGVLELDLTRGNPFDDEAFRFEIDREVVPANGVAVLTVSFSPLSPGQTPSVLTLRSNVETEGDDNIRIQLTGSGITTTVDVSPRRVDFRNVVLGSQRSLLVTLTNNADTNTRVEYIGGVNTRLCTDDDPSPFCIRFRDRTIDDSRAFQLASGESAQLEVRFEPELANIRTEGLFFLRTCASDLCRTRVDLSGLGVNAGLRCQPLDFGLVNPGSSRSLTTICENIASDPITIVNWSITNDVGEVFETEAPRPQLLSEGGQVTIEATFRPRDLGENVGTLRLETADPNPALRSLDVTLRGAGGGPRIEVSPLQLNFGRVALIAPARRNLVLRNTGFAPLAITEVQIDGDLSSSFSVVDGGGAVLLPGESKNVVIEFNPNREGSIQGRLQIVSNDSDQEDLEVILRGEGVNLPPCNFSVSPNQAFDFGPVAVTRTLQRSFEIRNEGTEPCLITATRLLDGSQAFNLPGGDVLSREIPAGAAETIAVQFAPQSVGSLTGEVEFSISSPNRPFNTLQMTGEGVESKPIIAPSEVDFGNYEVGCRARERRVTIYNTGASELRIDSISLRRSAGSAFTLVDLPEALAAGSIRLGSGDNAAFGVRFDADARSAYADAVEVNGVQSGSALTYFIPVDGRGSVDGIQIDEFTQLGQSKVDVLIVVGKYFTNSQELDELSSNAERFMQLAEAQGIDYQIGVTSADPGDEQGRFISAQAGTRRSSNPGGPAENRIITPATVPNAADVLAANVSLAWNFNFTSQPLLASRFALTTPRISGSNAGFLRPDAALSILSVSDLTEQSPGSLDFYVDFLRSVKGFRNTNAITVSSISAPVPPGSCNGRTGFASDNGRLIELAERTGGSFQSICAPDWGAKLEALSPVAFGLRSRFFLSKPTTFEGGRVLIDGTNLPARSASGTVNWTYNGAYNAIDFQPYAEPEPGAEIRVEYPSECL